ncbi:acyl-CoA thioesterase domain-containing protein [Gordonia sp. PKS22-38]|uniref:Acyl-CoA thioesterase domain-containing protein n=1 Tax=Gordonia prachuapensis TaxID=3115651 RepID=A0ABU7MSW5_9ACTN|nr:acyl-CoA thioesterase domain-containing protein [Gordonia sp. PKS22-38]
MSAALFTELLDVLDVARRGECTFVGPTWTHRLPRLFGGQVLAQALVAAGYTVPTGRAPHSLHAYFLRGGDPDLPVHLDVDTVRDGGTLSTRVVHARQHDNQIFTMTTSFAAKELFGETELDRQESDATPLPEPTTLAELGDRLASARSALPAWWADGQPFDIRFVDDPSALASGVTQRPIQRFWARAAEPRVDQQLDPTTNCALLAFLSDLNLLDPALMPLGRSWYGNGYTEGASVDHAMWFHAIPHVDQWLSVEQTSPVTAGGRALCTAHFRDATGALVATANQEGLVRAPTT